MQNSPYEKISQVLQLCSYLGATFHTSSQLTEQEHHRRWYSCHSFFVCTHLTSIARSSPVICRNTRMSLQSSGMSQVQEAKHKKPGNRFVAWSDKKKNLILYVNKTSKRNTDCRRNRNKSNPIKIIGEQVEVVEESKYFYVHRKNRLDLRHNCEAVHKKGQSRLDFLKEIRFFSVCSKKSAECNLFFHSVR